MDLFVAYYAVGAVQSMQINGRLMLQLMQPLTCLTVKHHLYSLLLYSP